MSTVIRKCPKDGLEHEPADTGSCEACGGALQFYCKLHGEWLVGATCLKCNQPAAAPATPTPAPAPKLTPVKLPPPPKPAFMSQPVEPPRSYGNVLIGVGAFVVVVIAVTLIFMGVFRLASPQKKTALPPALPEAVAPPVTTSPPLPKPIPPPQPLPSKPTPVTLSPPKPPPTPVTPKPPLPSTEPFPTYPPIALGISEILLDPDKYLGKLVKTSGLMQLKEIEKVSFELRQNDRTMQILYRTVSDVAKAAITAAPDQQRATVTGLLQRDDTFNSYYLLARDIELR